MTAAQAGILLGIRPLVEFVAGPFWGLFADRFRKGKLLLLFSLGAFIVFTLAIGFVQPNTPWCVVLDKNTSVEKCPRGMILEPAGKIIKGGAIGYIKEATGLGRKKRDTTGNQILDTIIDLSTFDRKEDMVAGMAPEYITKNQVCNYDEEKYGILVSPPHSTRVYREPAVQQAFMLLLLLVALGEFFSSPAPALADGYTLNLVSDQPKEFGKIRLFGSIGWALAMFIMGIGLDFSDTFRNHPCPTKNTTEKNYILCFVACTLLAGACMIVATQFRFSSHHEQHRPDAVGGLVMDTRIDEVDPAVAQKTRAKQIQANTMVEEAPWKSVLKAMMNVHLILYLLSVVCVGIGAGIVFAFLYWHLQDIGGSPVLFGFCSIINHSAEIAIYFHSFNIINKFGYVKTMYGCLGTNVIRFLLISWISNPWMILPLQAVQGCVLGLTWSTASSYISLVSPAHLKPTSQYMLLLLYHGLGKGLGTIIGGFIIASIGTRGMFFLLAFITAIVLGANYLANRLLKFDAIKYSHEFEDDVGDTLAPQGMPLRALDNKITDAFNQTSVINTNYGSIGPDPQDDAYDRYVSNPYG
uniref:Major facilitator superfamily associated domain-containing protein n=1 Tax=Acrobeloides nanus TaxID=290746 RepID=A0A914C6R7_9BILA